VEMLIAVNPAPDSRPPYLQRRPISCGRVRKRSSRQNPALLEIMILKTPDKMSAQRRIGRDPVADAKAVTPSLCAGTRRPLFDVEWLASRPLARIEADWGSSPISSTMTRLLETPT
jgi:hypothetical protein